jgi:pyrophosphatase PpaX
MPDRTYTTFLFDLDGTLIDSIALILSSYRHTMVVHRGTVPSDEVWMEGLGTPLRVQFHKFTDDPAEIDAMVETYRAHNMANHDAMVSEFPGMGDAVRHLREKGARLGIVTSKNRSGTERGLDRVGFRDLFDVLVTADDVERPKPDPEPVLRALDLLGSSGNETLFVGDSPHDLAAGRSAGVSTAAVRWTPFPHHELEAQRPDWWIEHPAQLTELGQA